MPKPRIAVLGGSFNPPTNAHKTLLASAVTQLGAEFGLFVPSSHAYVSRKMSKLKDCNTVYSEESRVKMLECLCKGPYDLHIDYTELGDDGRGHTYDTLVKLQDRYPNADIVFIIGADKLHILPKWHSHDALLAQFHFGVTTRCGSPGAEYIMQTIRKNPLLEKHADHFHTISMPDNMKDISSSEARHYIAKKNYGRLKDILDYSVINIIKSIQE